MKGKTVVIALGGNAILKKGEDGTISDQFRNTRASLDGIIALLKNKNHVVLTHGNGPIVGNILIRVAEGAKKGIPKMPLGICVADSQGGIGYMLQQCLQNRLTQEKIKKCVVTMITQVLVDAYDPAVKEPSKPVGQFYEKDEVKQVQKENPHWIIKEDAGRGFRRVVPSPFPLDIVEKRSIAQNIKEGHVVIACGGGGVPVTLNNAGCYEGFDAVVDKDLSSFVLAREIKADTLVILTNEDYVYTGYNTKQQKALGTVTLATIKEHYDNNEFPAGSMGPKVRSGILFLESGGTEVIITSIEKFSEALAGKCGTRIQR